MAKGNYIPFLKTWFLKQEIEAIKQDADEYLGLIRQMLQSVIPEQRQRLNTIRRSGPWDVEWEHTVRLQKERAEQVVSRLRRHRELRERIGMLEEKLPPATGLSRLRYVNPWILTWILAAVAVVVNLTWWLEIR